MWFISAQIKSSDVDVTPCCYIQMFSWVFYNHFLMGCKVSHSAILDLQSVLLYIQNATVSVGKPFLI